MFPLYKLHLPINSTLHVSISNPESKHSIKDIRRKPFLLDSLQEITHTRIIQVWVGMSDQIEAYFLDTVRKATRTACEELENVHVRNCQDFSTCVGCDPERTLAPSTVSLIISSRSLHKQLRNMFSFLNEMKPYHEILTLGRVYIRSKPQVSLRTQGGGQRYHHLSMLSSLSLNIGNHPPAFCNRNTRTSCPLLDRRLSARHAPV